MRLIDADALEKEICPGCDYYKNKYANCDDCAIANAPTIDAVEVVRCKECEHYIAERYTRSAIRPTAAYYETNICLRWDFDGAQTSPDGYCSYGERREESENK